MEVDLLVLLKVWSVTTGALLDWIGVMDSAVSTLAVHQRTIISASVIANQLKVWQLDYNTKHRSKSFIPAYCPLVVLSKDSDTVFYVKEGNNTEVFTWSCSEGETCNKRILGVIVVIMCNVLKVLNSPQKFSLTKFPIHMFRRSTDRQYGCVLRSLLYGISPAETSTLLWTADWYHPYLPTGLCPRNPVPATSRKPTNSTQHGYQPTGGQNGCGI